MLSPDGKVKLVNFELACPLEQAATKIGKIGDACIHVPRTAQG
jgi:hypothetical protein